MSKSAQNLCWIYTTWPDHAAAEAGARPLIEAGLAACANILPGAVSLYVWEGEMQREAEAIMLLKTSQAARPALLQRLVELHPYDEPCALVFTPEDALPGFARWVKAQTGDQGES